MTTIYKVWVYLATLGSVNLFAKKEDDELLITSREELGNTIKLARIKRNLTVRQLDSLVAHTTLSRVEGQNANPQLDTLIDIAKALGCKKITINVD